VLHELATGQPPFRSEFDQALIQAILHNDPEPVSDLREGLPAELEQLISKSLAKDPGDRYQSAEDMVIELEILRAQLDAGELRPIRRRRRFLRKARARKLVRRLLVPVAAVAVAVSAVLLIRSLAPPPTLHPDRVVVTAFANRTGDESLDPIGEMTANWIIQGLSGTEFVNVWPAVMGIQSSLAGSEETNSRSEFNRIRGFAREAKAGLAVSGAYYLLGDTLRIQASITDTETGQLLRSIAPICAHRTEPMEAIQPIRQRMLGGLASHIHPGTRHPPGSYPPLYEAWQQYMEGFEATSRNLGEAIRHFERAVELDPAFQLAIVGLAFAHMRRGAQAEADSLLDLVHMRRAELSAFERNCTDWLRAQNSARYMQALRHARKAAELAPTNVTVSHMVIWSAMLANRPREALRASARIDPAWIQKVSSIDNWRAHVIAHCHHMLGEYEEELEIMRDAIAKRPAGSAIKAYEIRALVSLGRIDEAEERIKQGSMQPDGVGILLRFSAMHLHAAGERDLAVKTANQAVDWFQSRESSLMQRVNVARTLYLAERFPEAEEIYRGLLEETSTARQSLAALDEMLERLHDEVLASLGALAARRSDPGEAREFLDRLQQAPRRLYSAGWPRFRCALVAAQLGERREALDFLRDALADGLGYWPEMPVEFDLAPLWGDPEFEELMRPLDLEDPMAEPAS
jgi:tetratricopeptide (TPR) repeat protein